MNYFIFFFTLYASVCCSQEVAEKDLIAVLDTIWETEQTPLRLRDDAMRRHGADSEAFKKYQEIYRKNHAVNEKKVKAILDTHGWPSRELSGDNGNLTLCNVLQHCDNSVRIHYLPMMRQAVKDKKLEARLLVRTEDRIATEKGELQLYGGQMKYYPATKSFNVWPVFDPANIDKRRAALGLEPIAIFLKARFNFEWNLEEQLQRTAEFTKQQKNKQ